MNYDNVVALVEDIENEVAIIKTVLENCSSVNENFVPMLIFYSSPKDKQLVVAPAWGDTFQTRMRSIADALHLFSAIRSYSVIVSFCTKAEYDNITYQMLNVYVMSEEHASAITLPYSTDDNGVVNWEDRYSSISSIDELETDDTGREVFSMFYHYLHLTESVLTPSNILTYLSARGAAIVQFSSKYQYYEMSELE
jgi:hypothetical protein